MENDSVSVFMISKTIGRNIREKTAENLAPVLSTMRFIK